MRVIALRLHVDDATHDNGPLKVLAETHELGILSDDEIRVLVAGQEAVNCTAPGGSIVAMRPLIVHASSKMRNPTRRRVLHIEYASSPYLDNGLALAVC
jgi:hypothetical protein